MAEISLTKAEQETIIILTADQSEADVYTCDPVMMRRLAKLQEKRPDVFVVTESDAISVTYKCPKKCIKVQAPRVMTDEQRKAACKNLARIRERNR